MLTKIKKSFNQVKNIFILISLFSLLFSLVGLNSAKAISSDGVERSVVLAPASSTMDQRVVNMRSKVRDLKYLPDVYVSKIEYDIKRHESNLSKRAYNLLNKNFLVSSYYDRLSLELQKTYNLINATKLFVNQHDQGNYAYVSGVATFTSVALTEVNGYIATINSTKSASLDNSLSSINTELNSLMRLNFVSFENLFHYTRYKALEDSLSLDVSKDIKINIDQAIKNIRTQVTNVLTVAEDPSKLID